MDLIGQLSNPSEKLETLLSLELSGARAEPRPEAPRVRKHRLGAVRDTMIAVLEEAGGPVRTAVIYEQVVERLGEPKPTYRHVRDFLSHRSRGDDPLFARSGYGLYALRDRID